MVPLLAVFITMSTLQLNIHALVYMCMISCYRKKQHLTSRQSATPESEPLSHATQAVQKPRDGRSDCLWYVVVWKFMDQLISLGFQLSPFVLSIESLRAKFFAVAPCSLTYQHCCFRCTSLHHFPKMATIQDVYKLVQEHSDFIRPCNEASQCVFTIVTLHGSFVNVGYHSFVTSSSSLAEVCYIGY